MALRSPIVSVLGHVDHGKSSILDAIRDTDVTQGEKGDITQAIGASIMPSSVIEKRCSSLMESLGFTLELPGLLFIDTPGHAAFSSLRKRGGGLADIAIVVVDINEGFKPQTVEAIKILRQRETPFLIVANKVDLISGWEDHGDNSLQSYQKQTDSVRQRFDNGIYEIVGDMYEEFEMESERYDKVDDFSEKVAIVPCSAIQNTGLDELLTVLAGISQRFLEQGLGLDVEGPGEGVIVEVKEYKGLGTVLDIILYDGTLDVGEKVFVGTINGVHQSKIRTMLCPKGLDDMRGEKTKFDHVENVSAATGVRVVLSDTPDDVIAGMPLVALGSDAEKAKKTVEEQIHTDFVNTKDEGVIIKADTIGGLEALAQMLEEKNIPVRKASIGPVSKKDILNAKASLEIDPTHAAVLGFNVEGMAAEDDKINVITEPITYNIIKRYEDWVEEVENRLSKKAIGELPRPGKMKVLRNCIFRQSNPCILGVEVLNGKVKNRTRVFKKENRVSIIKSIQKNNESIETAEKGDQVAISLPDATSGRQVDEDDILYTDMDEFSFRKWKRHSEHLSSDEKKVIKEIADIKREENSLWGV